MTTQQDLLAEVLETGSLRGLPQDHFIDGAFSKAIRNQTMDSYDPGKGEVFASFARGTKEDVDDAVASARLAFEMEWRNTTPVTRARILMRTSQLVLKNLDRLAIVECLDSGKILTEAINDVRSVARTFEYYAGACDKLQGDNFPLGPYYMGYSIQEPVGVTAHIIPWNYPVSTAARGIAPALAAGCSVVAKPAEQTPFSTLMLADLLTQAGLPDGVCNVVTGIGEEIGNALVRHKTVDHVTFTGSVSSGIHVMKAAADNVTRVILELGGKSPVIVLKDCNREKALDGVLKAIYKNAGQICSAGSRLIVEKAIHNEFVEELARRAQALVLGHGLRNPQLGPINSSEQLKKIAGFVNRAKERRVEVIIGGNITQDPKTGKGWFYQPTIIEQADQKDELVQEEIFGPVLAVQVAEDADHAIELANDCQFGLSAGIYTQNFSLAHQMARKIDAGQIYINEYFAGGVEVPFGGNKKSGFGRERGMEGLKNYCRIKSVTACIQ